ncbi:MAG: ABC transporter permease [Acidobacteriota bacterium]
MAHVPGLIWTLIRTDFATRYHGTTGGYLWALAKPLTMFAVLLTVFSVVFAQDPNYALNLVVGLFLWDFFAEATRTGVGALHAKGFLLARAKFPSWIVVLTSSANALLTLAIFTAIICTYIGLFRRPLGVVEIAAVMAYQLAFLAIVTGFSLAASSLYLRFRDLNQVWDMALQAGFFVAPIIYPLEIIPERYHFYLYLWLPTPVIQFSRSVLVHGVLPSARAHLLLLAEAVLLLLAGALIYRRTMPRAVEEL